MIFKPQFNRLAVLTLIVLLPVEGCVWGSVQYDRTLEKDVIKKITPGKTTRKNILEWFGPPEILAKKDGWVSLPSLETEHLKMRKVDSKTFFKYFSKKHPISEHHVVYYYFNEGEDINGFSLPIPIGTFFISVPATSGNLQLSELWVLVNRRTGRVEDYIFLESKEK
jgi:hypothetical protein